MVQTKLMINANQNKGFSAVSTKIAGITESIEPMANGEFNIAETILANR